MSVATQDRVVRLKINACNLLSCCVFSWFLRCPRNQVALDIIRASKVPIAAPSANRFGHISPTCSSHVIKNFSTIQLSNFPSQKELMVFEGGQCQIGIESTVCKVEQGHNVCPVGHAEEESPLRITVLRRGYITTEMIYQSIQCEIGEGNLAKQLSEQDIDVMRRARIEVSRNIFHGQEASCSSPSQHNLPYSNGNPESSRVQVAIPTSTPSTSECIVKDTIECKTKSSSRSRSHEKSPELANSSNDDGNVMCSPGMLLTHYAPSVPTYLCPRLPEIIESTSTIHLPTNQEVLLSQCVIIDAFNQLQHCRSHAVGFFTLCEMIDPLSFRTVDSINSNVFQQLHNAEDCALQVHAIAILIYDFKSEAQSLGEAGLAAYDRIYR